MLRNSSRHSQHVRNIIYTMISEIVVIHYLSQGPNSQANIPPHVHSRKTKMVHPRSGGHADHRVGQD